MWCWYHVLNDAPPGGPLRRPLGFFDTTMATKALDRYIKAFKPSPDRQSKEEKKKEEEAAVRRSLRKMKYSSKAGQRRRYAHLQSKNQGERLLASPTSTDINAIKVKHREKKAAAERAHMREDKKTEQRLHQLAGMPQGRGNKELKRIAEGGSVKETAREKAHRQRVAQLKGMPEGRGMKLANKMDQLAKGILPTKQKPAAAPAQTGTKPGGGKQAMTNPYASQNKQQEAAKKAAMESQKQAKEAAARAQEAAKKRMKQAVGK